MKNPFIEVAVIAAAMLAAFKENAMRDAGIALPGVGKHAATKKHFHHQRNVAGSKLARKAVEHKITVR